MANDNLLEVYRQLRTSQDKYVYFMLAASASAIAYALNRAQDRPLSTILIPWGLALFLWCLSFFFGCLHLAYVNSTIYANVELIKVQTGTHPEAGTHPQIIKAASEGIILAIENNSKIANRLGHCNFGFLFLES